MTIEIDDITVFNQGTQIKVMGVGGGGGNAVNYMMERGVQGVDFICANTDAQALSRSTAHRLLQLGTTGLGAGSKPEMARAAAEAASDEIRAAIEGTHMLFVTAGMGGGTGTGAAPVIARIAKEMGILTVGVVTKPFDWEGPSRMKHADEGLKELEDNVDSLIVVLNDKLLDAMGEDVTLENAFGGANDVLKNAVGGIAEIINGYGHVNADFEDVRTIMSARGKAMMGSATASGPDRARVAAEQAVTCPLLEGVDLKIAQAVLVLVTASKASYKLKESQVAMSAIKAFTTDDATVIFGASYDETLGDVMRVTVMATGLTKPGARRPALTVHKGTGTDDLPFAASPMGMGMGAGTLSGQAAMGQAGAAAAPDYGSMQRPSVWRNGRTQATAKVDALAAGGMGDHDIPAYLRKQAD